MTFENKFRSFVGRLPKMSIQEATIIGRELLKEFNEEKRIEIDSWKGKSSFEYNEVGDKLIIIKYQKPDKDSEAKEVRTEVEIKEFNRIKKAILSQFKYLKKLKEMDGERYIPSRDIAEFIYEKEWKEIFNDRKTHNRFTLILGVLDKKGIIKYRGGRIYNEKS